MNKKLDLDQSKLLGFKMLNKASDDQPPPERKLENSLIE